MNLVLAYEWNWIHIQHPEFYFEYTKRALTCESTNSVEKGGIWSTEKIAGYCCSRNYLLWCCFFLVACTWTKNKLSCFLACGSASFWRCCSLLTCPFVRVWRCRTCSHSSWRDFRLFRALTIQPFSGTSKWFKFWFFFNIRILIWRLPNQKIDLERGDITTIFSCLKRGRTRCPTILSNRRWLLPL